jgi:hypothetical protein
VLRAVAMLALCTGVLGAACVPPALETGDRLPNDGGPNGRRGTGSESGQGGSAGGTAGAAGGIPAVGGVGGVGGTGGGGGTIGAGGAGAVPASGGSPGTGGSTGGFSTGGSGTGGAGTGGSSKGGSGGVGNTGGTGGDDGTGGDTFCDEVFCTMIGGTCCDLECVFTGSTPLHCGDCSNVCTRNEVCSAGRCQQLFCEAPALVEASTPEAGSHCASDEVCCQSECCPATHRCCDDGSGLGHYTCRLGDYCLPP